MGTVKEYIRKYKRAYPLMDREEYLRIFGLTPEEIFTSEELHRISVLVQRDTQVHEEGGATK